LPARCRGSGLPRTAWPGVRRGGRQPLSWSWCGLACKRSEGPSPYSSGGKPILSLHEPRYFFNSVKAARGGVFGTRAFCGDVSGERANRVLQRRLLGKVPGSRRNDALFPLIQEGKPITAQESTSQVLEEFRGYLETLTYIQVSPRLRSKFGLSDIISQTLWEAYQALDRIRALDEPARKRWLRRMLVNNLLEEIARWK